MEDVLQVPDAPVVLSTASTYPEKTPAAFEMAAQLGYDGLEVMVTTDPASQDIEVLRRMSDSARSDHVVAAPCLLLTQRVWGGEPGASFCVPRMPTEKLGAKVVVVHPPFRWQREYAREFEQGLARMQEETDVVFSVENMFPVRARTTEVGMYAPHWNPVDQPSLLGIAGIGTALGPVVGGLLAATVGWQWVFLLNVPVAVLALVGGLRLTESRDESAPRSLAHLDWWGVVTVVGGLAGVSLAIDDVSTQGPTSAATLVPLVAGVALLVAFGWIEQRGSAPLVRPSLLRNHVFVLLAVAGALANVGSVVYIVAATLELQDVRGLSAGVAGLAFFVSSVGLAACGPLSGRLSARYPPGVVMGVAVVASAPALVLLALVGPLPLYVVALALCGITTGMGYALGQVAVQNILPPARSAEGTSVMLTVLICTAGIAVVAATAVIEVVGDQRATSGGIALVLILVAALLLVAGLVTLATERRRLRAGAAGVSPST